MSKNSEDILEEIHENILHDRSRLDGLAQSMIDAAGEDMLAKAAIAEPVSKIVEAMAKSNAQLLEVAKIKLKKETSSPENDDEFSDEETDGVFDEIENVN